MREWQQWQEGQPASRNRFLFKESRNFFQSEYGVEASAGDSAIAQASGWAEAQLGAQEEAVLAAGE